MAARGVRRGGLVHVTAICGQVVRVRGAATVPVVTVAVAATAVVRRSWAGIRPIAAVYHGRGDGGIRHHSVGMRRRGDRARVRHECVAGVHV